MNIFINTLLVTLAQSAPYIVIGYFIAALVREYIPMRLMVRHFGTQGVLPVIKAVLAGALLPICSCGSVPLGIGIFKNGAARGTTLAFMISAPAISPVSILLAFSLLGPTLASTYIIVVLIGSFLIGLAGNLLLKDDTVTTKSLRHEEALAPLSPGGKLSRAIRWAYWDFGSEVSLDLLFGLSLAALVVALIPTTWITAAIGKQDIWTLFYIILIGIPVYVCAVPGIALVRNLALLGMTPGAALAFLISGPATNLGTLNAIRHQMGNRTGLYYLILLILLALAGGLIVDHVFLPNYQYATSDSGGNLIIAQCCVPLFGAGNTDSVLTNFQSGISQIPVWHYPFIVILAFTLVFGGIRHIYRVFVNPCSFCQFWREEIEESVCRHKCWLKWLHSKIFGKK